MLLGIVRLEVDSSIESMMVEGDPEHSALEAREAVFGK